EAAGEQVPGVVRAVPRHRVGACGVLGPHERADAAPGKAEHVEPHVGGGGQRKADRGGGSYRVGLRGIDRSAEASGSSAAAVAAL
ncbi:MAG TPA: hypothetical protein VD948_04400, partial [Rhodothermales bacterium]|nr:hypothetical protein [Rhodothermales bacterium]